MIAVARNAHSFLKSFNSTGQVVTLWSPFSALMSRSSIRGARIWLSTCLRTYQLNRASALPRPSRHAVREPASSETLRDPNLGVSRLRRAGGHRRTGSQESEEENHSAYWALPLRLYAASGTLTHRAPSTQLEVESTQAIFDIHWQTAIGVLRPATGTFALRCRVRDVCCAYDFMIASYLSYLFAVHQYAKGSLFGLLGTITAHM